MQDAVKEFVQSLEEADQNPYGCVRQALIFLPPRQDPAKFIDPSKLRKYEAAFLRATNRVILDPYDHDDAPLGGRKTFHIKWLQTRVIPEYEKNKRLAILGKGATEYESTHFRLRVDGCRYRFFECSDCNSPNGIGEEIPYYRVDMVRQMIRSTHVNRALFYCTSCTKYAKLGYTRPPTHLPFPTHKDDYTYNVINHEIAAEALEACLLPFIAQLEDNPVRYRLTPANGVDRIVTVTSIRIDRETHENPIERHGDDAKLPYDVRHALSRMDEWAYVVHWAEKDLRPTRAFNFDTPAAVYNINNVPQGTVIVFHVLNQFERPQWMQRPVTMEQIEAKMEADEDALEEKTRKQLLDNKARAYHRREQNAAVQRGETYDPMQWEPDEDDGNDE